jgi:hypothetical protein
MCADVTMSPTLPNQAIGHFLRGNKPLIYLLQTNDTSTWTELLEQELAVLRGADSCLSNKDIAVIADIFTTEDTVNTVLERWNSADNKIPVLFTEECASAEYPAVIVIWKHDSFSGTVKLPDSREEITLSDTIPNLYIALSRARVYCTVILYDYTPNTCQYTDKLLEELRQRNDVCTVIER